jgi:hypothetical protein
MSTIQILVLEEDAKAKIVKRRNGTKLKYIMQAFACSSEKPT